jgi:hypothetical protein
LLARGSAHFDTAFREVIVRHSLLLCLFVLLSLGSTRRASAQEGGEKLRLGAAMLIDFGGDVQRDPPARLNSVSSSARVTPGFRLHADYDVHRYVSVGGLLRFGFWRSEHQDSARNMLVDVAARVNGHYDWKDFRFYGVFAVGPSFNRLRSENLGGLSNPGVGAAISVAPGVEWWFSRRFAVFTEIMGWSGHYFRHDYDRVSGHMQFRMNQVLWQIGMLVGL